MKLFTYYRRAAIYPSLFVLFFYFIYLFLDNYSGNWQEVKSTVVTSAISAVIYSLVMCILSLSIFLNRISKLNTNLIWNFLTWFLLPLGYLILFFIHDIRDRIYYGFGFGHDFIFLFIITIPFVIGLYTTFRRFRQVTA